MSLADTPQCADAAAGEAYLPESHSEPGPQLSLGTTCQSSRLCNGTLGGEAGNQEEERIHSQGAWLRRDMGTAKQLGKKNRQK